MAVGISTATARTDVLYLLKLFPFVYLAITLYLEYEQRPFSQQGKPVDNMNPQRHQPEGELYLVDGVFGLCYAWGNSDSENFNFVFRSFWFSL